MSCSKIVDPEDPAFEIVTIRVPTGTVECAETLASGLAQQRELQRRHQLLFDLRNAPIGVLEQAKTALPN